MAGPVTEGRIAVRVGGLGLDAADGFGWAVAFGVCAIGVYILRGLFAFSEGTAGALVGWIPGVGKWVNSKLEHAEQKLTHWVGQAAASSEQRMADAFHASANELQSIGHEIYGQAIAYWQLAHWVYRLDKSVLSGEAWQEIFHNTITSVHAKERYLDRQAALQRRAIRHADQPPIAAGIKVHTKPIAARTTWIDAHALPSLREQTRAREDAIAREGTALGSGVATAERGIDAAWDKLRDLSWRTAGVGAVALVTVALGRLGAGWLRCSNVSKIGKRACGMDPRALESLLAGTLAIVGTISIVEFAKELQLLVGEGESAIHGLIREK